MAARPAPLTQDFYPAIHELPPEPPQPGAQTHTPTTPPARSPGPPLASPHLHTLAHTPRPYTHEPDPTDYTTPLLNPVAFDRRRLRTIDPDASPSADRGGHFYRQLAERDPEVTVYAVESLAPGAEFWELRPFNEHRGGRAWTHNPHRVHKISGLWHHGALVFTSGHTALQAARAMRASRSEPTEFRVVRIQVSRTLDIYTQADYARDRSGTPAAQQPHPGLPPSAPAPNSLGTMSGPSAARFSVDGLSSWLTAGSQHWQHPEPAAPRPADQPPPR